MHGYCTLKLGNIIGLILKCLDTVYILLQNYTAVRINPFSLFADGILLLFGFWAFNGYVTWFFSVLAEEGGQLATEFYSFCESEKCPCYILPP